MARPLGYGDGLPSDGRFIHRCLAGDDYPVRRDALSRPYDGGVADGEFLQGHGCFASPSQDVRLQRQKPAQALQGAIGPGGGDVL